jgi:hypothetical protein
MKIILFLVAGCVALTGGFALSLAQNPSSPAPIVSIGAWSRPDVNVPEGFQVRRKIDKNAHAGPSVALRFEPIPAVTIQALQQTAASNHTNLVWHPSSLDGAAVFIDYGFPEAEYYHPQRTGGTLMCHRAHLADADPLVEVGAKDITAHINFSAVALAGQDAGLTVLGYTPQARFLLNCGLLDLLAGAGPREVAAAQKLLNEHEMGELFKVIGFARGIELDALGFAAGDRSHTL